jgi:hypothetical protein
MIVTSGIWLTQWAWGDGSYLHLYYILLDQKYMLYYFDTLFV